MMGWRRLQARAKKCLATHLTIRGIASLRNCCFKQSSRRLSSQRSPAPMNARRVRRLRTLWLSDPRPILPNRISSISRSSFATWEIRALRLGAPRLASFVRSVPKLSICSTPRRMMKIRKSQPAPTTCCDKSRFAGFKPMIRRPRSRCCGYSRNNRRLFERQLSVSWTSSR